MGSILRKVFSSKKRVITDVSLEECVSNDCPCVVRFRGLVAGDLIHKLTHVFDHAEQLSIEKRTQIQYVKLQVLQDPNQEDSPLGRSRGKYVGQELLVPLKYPGHVIARNRILSKKIHYTSILQIVENDTKYFTTEEDTYSLDLEDRSKVYDVPMGTKMAVSKFVTHNKQEFVICTSGEGKSHCFHVCHPLKCSAFPPHVSQTLEDAAGLVLPKIVTFGRIANKHLVPMSDGKLARLTAIANGPIRLLSVENKDFVIIRKLKDDTVVLFPWALASGVKVNKNVKRQFNFYTRYLRSNDLERSLYMIEDTDLPVIFKPSQREEADRLNQYDTINDVITFSDLLRRSAISEITTEQLGKRVESSIDNGAQNEIYLICENESDERVYDFLDMECNIEELV